ncbi:MAG: response regulator [Candidatus Binatia bacterium]
MRCIKVMRPQEKSLSGLTILSEVEKPGSDKRRAKNILVVDENPGARSRVAQLLEDGGYDVQQAESGQAAIDLLNRIAFAAVVTSLRMTGDVSGIDVLVHQELVSPGGAKILIADFISKRVEYVSNFLGAVCIPTEIPAEVFLDRINRTLSS